MRQIGSLCIILLFLGIGLVACTEENNKKVIKLAHGLDINHPVHKGMVYLAEDLTKRSGGKLSIDIYPSGQLGQERELLELLQIGSVGMTKVSAAVMENFAPNFKVLGLPYLFRDRAHSFKVLDGEIGQSLLAQGEKYWLKGLCFYDAGSRSFYTKDRPTHAPKDLKGLKIRVMNSNTAFNMVSALGGAPTPISYGELYTALQQGVVDGAENNPPSFYTSRHYEVCKFYSIDEHTMVPDVLLMSTHTWNKLNEQERKWLEESTNASVIKQREYWAASEQQSLKAVQEAGVEIIYPEKEPFQNQVKTVYETYKNEPEIDRLIKEIQKLK